MSISTFQKIIKIGSSLGVTLPSKDLKRLDINQGDEVEVIIKKVDLKKKQELEQVMADYEDLKKQYEQKISELS